MTRCSLDEDLEALNHLIENKNTGGSFEGYSMDMGRRSCLVAAGPFGSAEQIRGRRAHWQSLALKAIGGWRGSRYSAERGWRTM